jgi:transcriptional regulator with XRE-family HTH domain
MRPTFVFATLIVVALCAGCASTMEHPSAAPVSTTSLTPTTPNPATAPFDRSANDVIEALNLQLPLIDLDGARLPTAAVSTGVFGGRLTSNAEVYLQAADTLFSKVRAVTVRVTGTGGTVATPAKLLSGVGSSVCGVSADAVAAFTTDVLPHLSSIDRPRTVLSVGAFYTLTVVVLDSSTLAFIFTPAGVDAPAGSELLGSWDDSGSCSALPRVEQEPHRWSSRTSPLDAMPAPRRARRPFDSTKPPLMRPTWTRPVDRGEASLWKPRSVSTTLGAVDADAWTSVERTGGTPMLSFRDKLNAAFDAVRPNGPDGPEYRNTEVAAALGELGVKVTGSYLGLLRNGERDNPTVNVVQGLATFFDLDPVYFLTPTTPQAAEKVAGIHRDLMRLAEWRDKGVLAFALRAMLLEQDSGQLAEAAKVLLEQVMELRRTDRESGGPGQQ